MPRKKATEAQEVAQGDAVGMDELADQSGVEPVSEGDFAGKLEAEVFANQILTVMVHETNDENALDVVRVECNRGCQNFIRGRQQKVKRKYVEVLARTRTTTYKQITPNISEPEKKQMVPRTNLSYPFSVLNDPHPNGREWLQAILEERH